MNKFLGFAFVIIVGLFVFQQKNPAKFEQFVTNPAMDLKTTISNFSYADKKEQFFAEKSRIEKRYLSLRNKYQEPLDKLISEREELATIVNPDLTVSEKLAKINKQIADKKEEYLAKKAEIEKQIGDLEKRYNDLKDSIQKFQKSIEKIREGIEQGQESIDQFSGALSLENN
jgi:uncharacterized phage infection (PIP) family protein YhgE